MNTEVVLQKLKTNAQPIIGRLANPPKKGSPIVIEFADNMHEYVTTPVVRFLQMVNDGTFYIETTNSRYRLSVRTVQPPKAVGT